MIVTSYVYVTSLHKISNAGNVVILSYITHFMLHIDYKLKYLYINVAVHYVISS